MSMRVLANKPSERSVRTRRPRPRGGGCKTVLLREHECTGLSRTAGRQPRDSEWQEDPPAASTRRGGATVAVPDVGDGARAGRRCLIPLNALCILQYMKGLGELAREEVDSCESLSAGV